MRAAFLMISPYSITRGKMGPRKTALILMKHSHFDRTPQYTIENSSGNFGVVSGKEWVENAYCTFDFPLGWTVSPYCSVTMLFLVAMACTNRPIFSRVSCVPTERGTPPLQSDLSASTAKPIPSKSSSQPPHVTTRK